MPSKHLQDGVENGVQFFADVLSQKAQHEVAVFLQQLVLPPVAAIRDRIGQVLSAIEFDGEDRLLGDSECFATLGFAARRTS